MTERLGRCARCGTPWVAACGCDTTEPMRCSLCGRPTVAVRDDGRCYSCPPDDRRLGDTTEPPTCGACGGDVDVRYRGYTDDGSPMLTCARCGGPCLLEQE